MANQDDEVQNFLGFGSPKELQRNKMTGRVAQIQYESNNPIEDRFACQQLKTIDGFVVSVFDGHGGFHVSDLAHKILHKELEDALKELKPEDFGNRDQYICMAIQKAFDRVEAEVLQMSQKRLEKTKSIRGGSCCLLHLVSEDKVYTANLGDCRSIIVKKDSGNPAREFVKLNRMQNANSKKEQERLRKTFPNDQDIVVCRNNSPTSCYVKDRLQPTRVFGDFSLKDSRFFPSDRGPFNGPYVTSKPEIRIYKLKEDDTHIIAGSDGLWDELSFEDIVRKVRENKENAKEVLLQNILNSALEHAAKNARVTMAQLEKLPRGSIRRNIHDDMTIVVVDLKNQVVRETQK